MAIKQKGLLLAIIIGSIATTCSLNLKDKRGYSHSIWTSKLRGVLIKEYQPSKKDFPILGRPIEIVEVYAETGWKYGQFVWISKKLDAKSEFHQKPVQLILKLVNSPEFSQYEFGQNYVFTDKNGNVFEDGGNGLFRTFVKYDDIDGEMKISLFKTDHNSNKKLESEIFLTPKK